LTDQRLRQSAEKKVHSHRSQVATVDLSQPVSIKRSPPGQHGQLRPKRTRQGFEGADVSVQTFLSTPTIPWTERNPKWGEKWRIDLTYSRTTVNKDDVLRLDEGSFLNDNLIGFYLKYLHDTLEKENPEVARRIYFQNTYFYTKLRQGKGRSINYDGVKTWTSKIDLLSYDYIVVPVNENSHWWVAIICNAPKLLLPSEPRRTEASRRDDSYRSATPLAKATVATEDVVDIVDDDAASGEDPMENMLHSSTSAITAPEHRDQNGPTPPRDGSPITAQDLTADFGKEIHDAEANCDDCIPVVESDLSAKPGRRKKMARKSIAPPAKKYNVNDPRIITLDSLGGAHSPTVNHLKHYLLAEIKARKYKDIADPGSLGMTAKDIPQQENFCDCGVFLLGYIRAFIKDPDGFISGVLQREKPAWEVDAPALRSNLRELIFDLQKQRQAQEEEAMRLKTEVKKEREAKVTASETGRALPPAPDTQSQIQPFDLRPDPQSIKHPSRSTPETKRKSPESNAAFKESKQGLVSEVQFAQKRGPVDDTTANSPSLADPNDSIISVEDDDSSVAPAKVDPMDVLPSVEHDPGQSQ
jgi:sentrin-specific protease 7